MGLIKWGIGNRFIPGSCCVSNRPNCKKLLIFLLQFNHLWYRTHQQTANLLEVSWDTSQHLELDEHLFRAFTRKMPCPQCP